MKKGFTLVELLVVIAVIGILSAIITPNLLNARNSARKAAGQRFDSSTYHSIGDYLVGEWVFDVPTNATIDTSGMGYNLSTSSSATSPTYFPTGGYNSKGAYSFDGGDYFISTLTPQTPQGTVSGWIKSSSGSTVFVGSANTPESKRSYFGINNSGKCGAGIGGVTFDAAFQGTTNVADNNWHLCVASYDGTTVKIYVDGKLEKSASQGAYTNETGYPYYIGAINNAGSVINYFPGYIDDVRIYATALSSSEIEKLYTEGKGIHSDLARQ